MISLEHMYQGNQGKLFFFKAENLLAMYSAILMIKTTFEEIF